MGGIRDIYKHLEPVQSLIRGMGVDKVVGDKVAVYSLGQILPQDGSGLFMHRISAPDIGRPPRFEFPKVYSVLRS